MNPLRSLPEYERFVYTLQQRYPSIRRSTLTVVRRGRAVARLTGELEIGNYHFVVREKLSFADGPGRVISYTYVVWRGDERLYWYDSQQFPFWVKTDLPGSYSDAFPSNWMITR